MIAPQLPLSILRLLNGADEKEEKSGVSLRNVVEKVFPKSSGSDLDLLGPAVRALFTTDFKTARELSDRIEELDPLRPFVSYLRGLCHLELAGSLGREAQALRQPSVSKGESTDQKIEALKEKRRVELRAAENLFRSDRSFLPCRLEIANAKIQALAADSDISQSLLTTLQELSADESSRHIGPWLLYRGFAHRFRIRLRDPAATKHILENIVSQMRSALRETIRRQPRYSNALVALADSFVFGTFGEETEATTSRDVPRTASGVILAPDYESALRVLKSSPVSTLAVVSKLARYLSLSGASREARDYYVALTLVSPTVEHFSLLLGSSDLGSAQVLRMRLVADSGDYPSALGLDQEQNRILAQIDRVLTDESDGISSHLAILIDLLRSGARTQAPKALEASIFDQVRSRLESEPSFRAFRLLSLGQLYAERLEEEVSPTARQVTRANMYDAFERSLGSFAELDRPASLMLLNNYAWQLVHDDDAVQRARGLELAIQAKERVPNPKVVPTVHDTYAWGLFRNGKSEEADKVLQDLLDAVDQPSFRYHRAEICFTMGRLEEAWDELDRSLESAADFNGRDRAVLLRGRLRQEFQKRASGN